jgi:ABC-type phosphate transport system substrate-binding protein
MRHNKTRVMHAVSHLLAVAVLLVPLTTLAGDVIVIAHSGVNLAPDDVRDVFTGDKQMAGNVKLTPIDNGSAQGEFLAKVIKVDATKYASIWAKKAFREGLNPPPTRATDAEIIAAVKSTPGAIGYVSKAPADVKVIQKY